MKKILMLALSFIIIIPLCFPAYSKLDSSNKIIEEEIVLVKQWMYDQKISTQLNSSWQNANIKYNCSLRSFNNENFSHYSVLDSNYSDLGYIIYSTENGVVEFSFNPSPYKEYLTQDNLYYAPGYHMIKKGSRFSPIKAKSTSAFLSNANNCAGENIIKSNPDYYKLISGVPDYTATSTYLCIPTAISNVIRYWDLHGYPNLVTGSITNMRNEINTLMGTNISNNTAIAPTIHSYCHQSGRYPNNFTATPISNPTFNQFKTQISNNRPTLVGFSASFSGYGGAHMTTGVGYYYTAGYSDRYIYVHDGWSSTDEDYFVKWGSYNDFICCIVP